MQPRARPKQPTEAELFEQTAVTLKAEGWNSSVVTSKMIRQHGMTEEAAEALVGRLYGKKVSARTGDTTVAVMTGIGLCVVGAAGTLLALEFGFGGLRIFLICGFLGMLGSGLTKIIIAMVNMNARDDLRERRD